MKIDVRVADISAQLQSQPGDTPYAMIKREVAEGHLATPALVPASRQLYHILQTPLDKELTWSFDKGGSHVAVPMHPYVFGTEAELLVKFGLEFGALAATQHVSQDKMLIVMSTVFGRPDNQPGYCVYVGVAVRQE